MKTNLLIFPCGTEVGLEINRSLAWSNHVELFGASSISSNHGKYVFHNYIEGVPFIDDSEIINKLNCIIDTYSIDFIYPAHDSVVLKLSERQQDLHCKVIGSPPETCRICRSKIKTYETFKNILNVPEVYRTISNDTQFPIFLKPDIGQGSKGVHIAKSIVEAEFYMQNDSSLIPLEYIPGAEYTIDCFTDRYGVLRFVGGRKRIRINNGISVDSIPVNNDRLDRMANLINSTLVFRGAWFFQAKEKINGDLTLLEIAPRIAGTMGLYRNLGINFAMLSLFDGLDIDVDICANKYFIEIDRALINRYITDLDYKNVYIDLDDTLIFNNSVNIWVIAFLYQCINNGVKVHLLSRHRKNIEETLKKYRLNSIFDTITIINDIEDKARYIREPMSIFIDDSFSERQCVANKLGIPTFETSSIESLIDWRV